MNDATKAGGKIRGEIFLVDAHGNSKKTPIAGCLEITAPGEGKIQPKYDSSGGFEADLNGDGPFILRAKFDDDKHIFAFSETGGPDEMPLIEIPVQAGQSDIKLFAWAPSTSDFGHNPAVDAQFARDTAKGCVALHDLLIQQGKTEAEAWEKVKRVLETAFRGNSPIELRCVTCGDRYYTPGTPYYMNYPAYSTCMYKPPCT